MFPVKAPGVGGEGATGSPVFRLFELFLWLKMAWGPPAVRSVGAGVFLGSHRGQLAVENYLSFLNP